jgi:hypothetical protein
MLLNEIILEVLKKLIVPEFPKEDAYDFYDPYNGKLNKYEDKKCELIRVLEDQMGVHLNFYHTALTYLGKYKTVYDKNVFA